MAWPRGRTVALLAALALLLTAAEASARPPGGPPGPRDRRGPPPIHAVLERHAERLGIDEVAQIRISEIAAASRERDRELKDELRGLHERLRALLAEESPDEPAVMALADEISAVENEAHKLRLRTLLQIRALLTPEQLAELVAIREEQRGRHERRVAEACDDAIAALCPDTAPGHETFECLRKNRDALSPACREASRPPHPRDRRSRQGDPLPHPR